MSRRGSLFRSGIGSNPGTVGRRLVAVGASAMTLALVASGCGSSSSPQDSSNAANGSSGGASSGSSISTGSATKDPYLVGASGDLTSFGAETYAGLVDGVRIYFNELNKNGGIDGHPVKLLIRDNKDDPSTVASDLRYFKSQKVNLVYLAAFSTNLGAYTSGMGDMPTLYGNDCYPPAPAPSPAPNFFCVGASNATDYLAMARAAKLASPKISPGQPVKYSVIEEDVPGCVSDMNNYIVPDMQQIGGQLVSKTVIPTSTTDMTATARQVMAKNPNVIIHYCSSSNAISLANALKRFGFKGMLIAGSVLPGVLTEMEKIKNPSFYTMDWWSLPDSKPVWGKIDQAAKDGRSKYGTLDLRFGWADGIGIQASLEKCGFPCSSSQLNETMNHLTIDTPDMVDLMGNKSVWTPNNHTGPTKRYFIYHWDSSKNAIVNILPNFDVPQVPVSSK